MLDLTPERIAEIVKRAEDHAKALGKNLAGQRERAVEAREWALKATEETREAFRRIRKNTPIATHVEPGKPLVRHYLDLSVPTMADLSGELREMLDIAWRVWEPQPVGEALGKSAGALADVDREKLLADIHAQREQDSRGRPA